jgi:hypothetical protein
MAGVGRQAGRAVGLGPDPQLSLDLDKRWRGRREMWVRPPEYFRPEGWVVDVIPERIARPFVLREHYSGSYVAARLALGLFGPGAVLRGVAVLSVPMNQRVIPSYTGMAPGEGVELGRFVCTPEVAFNGESWFLSRCWPLIREALPEVRAVISYADPMERRTAGGLLCKPAHRGTIYQAVNAIHAGRSRKRKLLLLPDGRVLVERAICKVTGGERGGAAVTRMLESMAGPRRVGEAPEDWVRRATEHLPRLTHPGNYAYVFGTTRRDTQRLRERHGGGLPYPKAA